jgi:hypothetical protein
MQRVAPQAKVVVEGGEAERLAQIGGGAHLPRAHVGVHGRVPEGPVERGNPRSVPGVQTQPLECLRPVKDPVKVRDLAGVEMPQRLVERRRPLEELREARGVGRPPPREGQVERGLAQEHLREGVDLGDAPRPDRPAVSLPGRRVGPSILDVIVHRRLEHGAPVRGEAFLRTSGSEASEQHN